ncbi:hypothetical protein PR202_gb28270 [Eleusine coracana subsp. coracana]|uniref:Bifunctional inhibitor/plant lipid transfer protein/seed storage helical domain-containing protein n=1 Tax=Eleusine coracana subsp. coracana TaxID=191504 RepID=A0AAV5FWE0_ELECO|nr:hypothetical protein PR202_gb28270 [Eleusine coracana subsp. coracana]
MAMQMAVALLALSVLASSVAAQSPNPPSCASKLVPCGAYMNGTGPPPETCCGPLKDAVKNELPCLCALYASPEIFKALNINISDALNLSKRCGVSDTTTACAGIVGSPAKSPPGSPSGGGSGSGKNAGHRTLSDVQPLRCKVQSRRGRSLDEGLRFRGPGSRDLSSGDWPRDVYDGEEERAAGGGAPLLR